MTTTVTPGGSTSSMSADYERRRGWVQDYFDRTASAAWARLTGDAPVSGVRATVRAGRERMRAQLLAWLPEDLAGRRVLDAGCGPGTLAVALAARGAHVVAADLSPTLVALGRERAAGLPGADRITWHVGDMLDPVLGRFDHVVAMDSLIHYRAADTVRALAGLTARCADGGGSVLFTFAPRTLPLTLMHVAGRLFPRGDRAPAIEPVAEAGLRRLLAAEPELRGWRPSRTERVAGGFYISQAMELRRA